jgi:hypothetical protein
LPEKDNVVIALYSIVLGGRYWSLMQDSWFPLDWLEADGKET